MRGDAEGGGEGLNDPAMPSAAPQPDFGGYRG